MNELIIDFSIILSLIGVTFTCIYLFICALLFSSLATLHTTKDISNTELGRSIVGSIYETVIPTSFKCDKEKYNLTLWKNKSLLNPTKFLFNIKLKPGIKFKITTVLERKEIDSRTNLRIKIRLLDNIPLDMIDDRVEADITNNPNLTNIFDKKDGLQTKNLQLGLNGSQFFDYKSIDIIDRNAIKEKDDVIRKVT